MLASTPELQLMPLQDVSLCEVAVAICINGVSQAVMMASKKNLPQFGLGFILSEGLIGSVDEVLDIKLLPLEQSWQVDIQVLAQTAAKLKQRRRVMAGPSGCGLCGIDSLQQSMDLSQLQRLDDRPVPAVATLELAQQVLSLQQRQLGFTRGHHSAAFFDLQAQLLEIEEDVGRHSALDKLIGSLAQAKQLEAQGFVLLTSRCSFDLVVKMLRVGLNNLFTLAPPSRLAVTTARDFNLRLFCLQQGQLKRFA